MLPSILERKFFAVEGKFLTVLSIVASYDKRKWRALHKNPVKTLAFHLL